MIATVQKDKY